MKQGEFLAFGPPDEVITEANLEAAKIADGWIITKAPEEAEPEKVDAS